MQTKGTRLDGIVFTDADPRYAGKLEDPQGGDAAGKRSHDSQSREGRRTKLDLANVGADGVSAAVGICERESR